MSGVDRSAIAERIVAVHGMGVRALARLLKTSITMLDRLVIDHGSVNEVTYHRILPRLEELEKKIAVYRTSELVPQRTSTNELLLVALENHARDVDAAK